MRIVNIHEAKTHLSRLVDEVGEEGIIIARAGRPAARLVPYEGSQAPRRLGGLRGQISIPADFDAPLPEDLLDRFAGEGDAPAS